METLSQSFLTLPNYVGAFTLLLILSVLLLTVGHAVWGEIKSRYEKDFDDGRPYNADIAMCRIIDAYEAQTIDDIDLVTALRLWREGSWEEFQEHLE